jgi:hypothetical protein
MSPEDKDVDQSKTGSQKLARACLLGLGAALALLLVVLIGSQYFSASSDESVTKNFDYSELVIGDGVIKQTYQVPEEMLSCTKDSDCVFIEDPFCSGCASNDCSYGAVNKKYEDLYLQERGVFCDSLKLPHCASSECGPFKPSKNPQCVSNKCTVNYIPDINHELHEEPAILFEYTFGVQGMVEHIGLDHAGNWYYENDLPGENKGILQHGDTGTLTPDDLLRMQERIQESGIVHMELLQKNDDGLLCDGSTSYGLMVEGDRYDFRSPCVGEDTENTKKIFLELGGLADYLKSLCEKSSVDE